MKDYTKAEQLLLDIYDSSLADTGDRYLFPCKQCSFRRLGVVSYYGEGYSAWTMVSYSY